MSGTTSTPNYGLLKPVPGADNDQWGTHLNSDLDILDTQLKATDTKASAAYPASNPNGYQTAAQVTTALGPYALIASPTFTGDPKAPTPTIGDNDTSIATTSFVQTAVAGVQRRILYVNATATPNVGASTAEEVVYVWQIPAGTLVNVGDIIHTQVKVTLLGTTDNKTWRQRAGTTSSGLGNTVVSALTLSAAATTNAVFDVWCMKTGPNTQRWWTHNVQASNSVQTNEATTALNEAAAFYYSLTFQNSTSAVAACSTVTAIWQELLPLVSQTGTGGGSGGIPEAPTDGQTYGRIGSSASWSALTAPPAGSSTTPIMDGTATIGVGTTYARADHIHPTDTSRAPLASPVFTGDARAVTPTAGDNDTSIATTAFVQTAVASAPALNNVGRNLLHNPLFNVAQRGAGPFTASGYTADRWALYFVNGTMSVGVFAQTDAARAQLGDEAASWVVQIVFTGGAAVGSTTQFYQPIEGVRRLAGKTVTASFWAWAATAGLKLGLSLDQSFGTGGSPSAGVVGAIQAVTLGSAPARYSLTFNLPSVAGKTLGTNNNDGTTLDLFLSNQANAAVGVQSGTVYLWGVQLEIGTVATPLEKPDPRYDLANCQRFYSGAHANGRFACTAAGVSGVTPIYWPAMRATPTVTLVSSGARNNVSAVTATATGGAGGRLNITSAAAGDSYVLDEYYSLSADL